ncbi:MAG: hypothetical protein ACTSV2_08615 [Candidatus Thorarchaeota archaeon]
MSSTKDLAERVLKIIESIDSKDKDPLEFRLSKTYQELRDLTADVDSRIDIDVMLNEVLSTKISRIQELARVLAAPELYVSRLEGMNIRELGKLICYRHPVKLTRLEHSELTQSMERITQLHEAMTKERAADQVPEMSGLPNDYVFATEDAIFLEDLAAFAKDIPMNELLPIDDIISDDEFEVFLKKFLYVVVLISKGVLIYDKEIRVVEKVRSSF